jgi:hypothetical protein
LCRARYLVQQFGKSNLTHRPIRAYKDRFIRQLYACLGPEEFYRRRLKLLAANGKSTSCARLSGYLAKARIGVFRCKRYTRETG